MRWVFTINSYGAVCRPTLSQGGHLQKPKMFVWVNWGRGQDEGMGQLPPPYLRSPLATPTTLWKDQHCASALGVNDVSDACCSALMFDGRITSCYHTRWIHCQQIIMLISISYLVNRFFVLLIILYNWSDRPNQVSISLTFRFVSPPN